MPETLTDQLIRHEGLRLRPYRDAVGKITIGVGRNLTDCGISESEARQMLAADVTAAETDLATFPWYGGLTQARRHALIDMRFNLGPHRFREFTGMLAALAIGDFKAAAAHMRSSRWHQQVGSRVTELAALVERGAFPDEISI